MRIVIKVGTTTLTHPSGKLNIRRTEALCRIISDIKNIGHEVILVSSGAIGMGVGKLSLGKRPTDIATKQAAAAVGQCELMYIYDKLFGEYHHTVAQMLLTRDDLSRKQRHENVKNTLHRLLELGVLPIINENDTVATDEIKVGDNDTLSALIAVSARADLLILLSDIDGLFTADPHTHKDARLIPRVTEMSDDILALGEGSASDLGTGGMKTKLTAAKYCMENGCDMVIAGGADPQVLYRIISDESAVCTRFICQKGKNI